MFSTGKNREYISILEKLNILQCIPLKNRVIIIGGFAVVYGFIGIFFFLSMFLHYAQWQQQHKDKLDFYIYFHLIFFSITAIFVCGIFLFWGIQTNEDFRFVVAIWCIVIHLSILWSAIIGLFIYCLIVPSCFENQGPGYVFVLCIVTGFYSLAWVYAMRIINSYRFAT